MVLIVISFFFYRCQHRYWKRNCKRSEWKRCQSHNPVPLIGQSKRRCTGDQTTEWGRDWSWAIGPCLLEINSGVCNQAKQEVREGWHPDQQCWHYGLSWLEDGRWLWHAVWHQPSGPLPTHRIVATIAKEVWTYRISPQVESVYLLLISCLGPLLYIFLTFFHTGSLMFQVEHMPTKTWIAWTGKT